MKPENSFFRADQLPCGLLCFDDDGRLLAANREMLCLLGHQAAATGDETSAASVLGRSLSDLLTPRPEFFTSQDWLPRCSSGAGWPNPIW